MARKEIRMPVQPIQNKWTSAMPVETARQVLNRFLTQHGMRVENPSPNQYSATQDAPPNSTVPGSDFPKKAFISLKSVPGGVWVEAQIEDGSVSPSADPDIDPQREKVLRQWMWDLYGFLPPLQVSQPLNPPPLRPESPNLTGSAYAAYAYPRNPPQPYSLPPYPNQQPAKDKGLALVLEILPALFGFFGIGWIYAGVTSTGLIWLISVLGWEILAGIAIALTGGFAAFCVLPINIVLIVLSATNLNNYIKNHPEIFGGG